MRRLLPPESSPVITGTRFDPNIYRGLQIVVTIPGRVTVGLAPLARVGERGTDGFRFVRCDDLSSLFSAVLDNSRQAATPSLPVSKDVRSKSCRDETRSRPNIPRLLLRCSTCHLLQFCRLLHVDRVQEKLADRVRHGTQQLASGAAKDQAL